MREHFNSKAGGILKPKETIKEINRRYAPVGVFSVSWEDKIESGLISKTTKIRQRNNTFYVNLNNAKLYYVSYGFFRKRPKIKSLDFVEKMADLPLEAVRFLSDITKKGRMTHQDLNKKHFLFLDGHLDLIMMLKARELIDIDFNTYGLGRTYAARVDASRLGDETYDLGRFLETEEKDISGFVVDETVYDLGDVADSLRVFLDAKDIAKDLCYLPYDDCSYVDPNGCLRQDRLVAPRFKKV